MRFLAIDTATEMCSAAIQIDDKVISRELIAPRSHTELILPMVDELLAEAGTQLNMMDAIVLDRGPGAFTGLRIGAGVAQGLALGASLPLLAVSSLAALAQEAWSTIGAEKVLACIDARKDEVYWACYEINKTVMTLVSDERVESANLVRTPNEYLCYGIGSGFDRYITELTDSNRVRLHGYTGQRYPLARFLLPIAQQDWYAGIRLAPQDVAPVYLRNDVATVVAQPKT